MARPPTLREYLDDGMRLAHKDAVQLARETGVPDHWIRQFKAGRMGGQLDAERVRKVVDALRLDEAEVWTYLGRMDRVSALRRASDSDGPADDTERHELLRERVQLERERLEVEQERLEVERDLLEATRQQTAALRALLMQSLSPDEETRARLLPIATQWLESTPTPSPDPAAPRPSRAR